MAHPARPRRRSRKLLKTVAILLGLIILAVIALPWLASTPQARNYVVGKVNRVLAPSSVQIDSIGLSWFGPSRVGGFILRDSKGKAVIKVKSLSLDRSLTQLIRGHSDLGTLTVDGAEIDVERRPDGSIDLLDFLPKPSTIPPPTSSPSEPPPKITVKLARGVIKLKSPELPDGITAETIDLELKAPGIGPIRFAATLANPSRKEAVLIEGAIGAGIEPGAPEGLSTVVTGTRWPWAVELGGVLARGKLDGKAEIHRRGGNLTVRGDTRLLDLDASGPTLAGDRLKLDSVVGNWEAGLSDGVWSARRLSIQSDLAKVEGQGFWPPSPKGTTSLSATVDLAAISRQAPHFLRLKDGMAVDRGLAYLTVRTAEAVGGGQPLAIEAKISDVVARDDKKKVTLKDPATLSALLLLGQAGVQVSRLEMKTGFLDLTGSGDTVAGITASLDVDLGGLESQLRDVVDFGGLSLSGKGRLNASLKNQGSEFTAKLGGDLSGLKIAGILSDPLTTDALKIDSQIQGPIAANGLPVDWSSAHLAIKSAEGWLESGANRPQGELSVGVAVSCPLPPAGVSARTDSRLIIGWKDSIAEIRDLHVGLRSSVTQPELSLSARGRLDLKQGDLVLSPPEKVVAGDTVVLLPEGIHVTGLASSKAGMTIQAHLGGDVTGLDRGLSGWMGGAPIDLAGKIQANINIEPGRMAEERKIALVVSISDLVRSASDASSRKNEGPFGFRAKCLLGSKAIDFDDLLLACRYGTVTAKGRLDDPFATRLADFQGVIDPNWATIDAILAESVDPRSHAEGKPRGFRLKGPLAASGLAPLLAGLDAEVGIDLTGLAAMGVKVGPAPIVMRAGGGKWSIDPIKTTVNGGTANLLPGLAIDDVQGASLVLAADSSILNAEIDSDVARSLLAFVAPIMEDATEVKGKVSVAVSRCEIPLWGGPSDRSARVDGHVVFDNVTFGPGPIAEQIADFATPGKLPKIRLQQVLDLSIADHRVSQRGLSIPMGTGGTVDVSGSVGFDKTLALRADVPLPVSGTAGRVGLSADPSGTKVPLTIGGTLSKPNVDRRALAHALEDAGRKALRRKASGLESEALKRLGGSDKSGSPDVRRLLDRISRGGQNVPR